MGAVQVSKASCVMLASNPGFVLRSDAANAWDRACREFGKQVLITGAWRSFETQLRIFLERYTVADTGNGPYGDVRYYQGKRYIRVRGAAAAVPGTSNHGGGVAVDVKTGREDGDPSHALAVVFTGWNDTDRDRFLRVAAKHGWDDDEGRRVGEFWHLTYYPARDTHPAASAPTLDITPPAPAPQEDDMEAYDVWAYKAENVNGTRDAYSLLTNADRSVSALKTELAAVKAALAAVKSAVANLAKPVPAAVDEAAIAAAVAQKIGPAVASAVAAEIARRMEA